MPCFRSGRTNSHPHGNTPFPFRRSRPRFRFPLECLKCIAAVIEELRERITHLEKVIEEKDRIIDEQRKTIEEQARIIEEWKRGHRVRPRRGSKKKKSGKKKPGRKKGHEGSQREIPDHTDKEVERTKEECCGCQGVLTPTVKTEEVIIENVIPARVEIEKNILFEYVCQGCGQIHWSELPPEYGDKPLPGTSKLGPGALGLALDLRYDMGLSFHKIARYFEKHVGLKITPSGVYQLIERAADKAVEMAPDERICKFAESLHVIYIDALVAQTTGDESKQRGIRIRFGRLIANAELGRHPDVSRLQALCDKEFHGLLHFMSDPDIPAHNNGGELAARALVVMRKVIGGTRSQRGTEVHAHSMSTSQTAHKQGIDHSEFIINVLAAQHAGKPPPAIFKS